jgi:dimethylhistidine N-methyltransferase
MSAHPSGTTRRPEFIQTALTDPAAQREALVQGLLQERPAIAPKFFYDTLGSKLFEAITVLDEYTSTRTEALILEQQLEAIARVCGEGHTLVDLGAGNCAKAARLFGRLKPRRYVAVDISTDFLQQALQALQARHPELPMLGLGMDLDRLPALPEQVGQGARLMFYPGSSIGNYAPAAAVDFLRRVRAAAPGGALLIGVDLLKPEATLQRAYDDALGVTAAFNLNVLRNANRLLGSDFDLGQWRHVALFDAAAARIEMHLEAHGDLRVSWPGGSRGFRRGERLLTEIACKYTVEGFDASLRSAGYLQTHCWTDPHRSFAVFVAR